MTAAHSPAITPDDAHESVRPAPVPVWAVESTRTLPMRRVVFEAAKLVYVMEGAARIETARGTRDVVPGDTLALGERTWCSLIPTPAVRVWTIYLDEAFLRAQMGWALPVPARVIPGAHPREWKGELFALRAGMERLRAIEPLWRQMSTLPGSDLPVEVTAARSVALFGRAVELSVDLFLGPQDEAHSLDRLPNWPITGHLSSRSAVGQAARAAHLLRSRMIEPWDGTRLAQEVALSRSHLCRMFLHQFGVSPMRYLTEVRLTEYTRLVEETDLSLNAAARAVGWADSRVAASWFRRRFGISPSRFRRSAHPFVENPPL